MLSPEKIRLKKRDFFNYYSVAKVRYFHEITKKF